MSQMKLTIFVLSFRRFNAPTNQQSAQIQQRIKNCIDKINSVFKDEDLYQHGVIAVNNFELIEVEGHPEENHCIYSVPESDNDRVDFGDIFGYYYSFKNNISSVGIPDMQHICFDYGILLQNPDMAGEDCVNELAGIYSTSKDTALYNAFYKFRFENLPGALLPLINTDQLADEGLNLFNMAYDLGYIQIVDDEYFLDISLAYFTAIKWTFALINDLSANDAVEGFLPPTDFCKRRYIIR